MIVSRERQARRRAAIKAFDELFHADVVDGRRAETAIAILERYVEPVPDELNDIASHPTPDTQRS